MLLTVLKKFHAHFFFLCLVVVFILFENSYHIHNLLGNWGKLPPHGYSFMYLYTLLFLLMALSFMAVSLQKRVLAWLFITPLLALLVLNYLSPTLSGIQVSYISLFAATSITSYLSLLALHKTTLLKKIQDQLQNVTVLYKKIFSIDEFYSIPFLYYTLYGLVAFNLILLTYPAWSITIPTQPGNYICPTWFQSCYQWYFLTVETYTLLTYGLIGLLGVALTCIHFKKITLAHILLITPVLWITFLVVFLTHNDYYYGHVTLYVVITSWVILFLPNKKTTLGWILILTYFCSLGSKLNDSWFSGNVLAAIDLGLPVVGKHFNLIAAWTVLLMEAIVVWFLLSKQTVYRYSALAIIVGFHVFSISLIQYFFPAVAILYLCIVFLPRSNLMQLPRNTYHRVILFSITIIFILGQSVSLFIPGDSRITAEGKRFGLHMFTSLNSCHVTVEQKINNSWIETKSGFDSRLGYCEPYYQWYTLRQQCAQGIMSRLTMDISVNNESYYRVIDSTNVCMTNYNSLGHNQWIQIDENLIESINYKQKIPQGIL